MTLMSASYVALNKRTAGQGFNSVFGCFHASNQCLWMSEKVSETVVMNFCLIYKISA